MTLMPKHLVNGLKKGKKAMNERFKQFDPELYEKFQRDCDYHEIRSDEKAIIEDWLAKATITESLLSLLRKGLIDINGLSLNENDQFEPTFIHNNLLTDYLKSLQE